MSFLRASARASNVAHGALYNPRERLVLFRNTTATSTAGGYEPIDFDGTGTGLVKTGWQKEVRRFDRGAVTKQAVKVFLTRRYTKALLSSVAAYAILPRGASSVTEIMKCSPDGGVPQQADEIAWRWLGDGLVSYQYSLFARATEAGDVRVTESGALRVTEAA